jgi:AcrR family transcriptional regulator
VTQNTADKVLRAASDLFAERGYAATTTRAMAERAGVNEVTIFRRFENKLGVLKALGAQWGEAQAGFAVEHAIDPEDTKATLLSLARMEVAGARENGGAAMRLAFESRSVPEVAELIGDGPKRNQEGLAQYMAMRQAAGDLRDDIEAEAMAEAFFSLTSSYVMYRMVLGGAGMPENVEADKRIEQLVELFWTGAARSSRG